MKNAAKTVMVVDDDEGLRSSLCEALEDEGYDAICASDGQEALRLLRSSPTPCIILLDLMMPNMNGWQFRQEQKQDASLARICTAVMTANANIKSNPIEADHFLWKPVSLDKLLEVIEECCAEEPGAKTA